MTATKAVVAATGAASSFLLQANKRLQEAANRSEGYFFIKWVTACELRYNCTNIALEIMFLISPCIDKQLIANCLLIFICSKFYLSRFFYMNKTLVRIHYYLSGKQNDDGSHFRKPQPCIFWFQFQPLKTTHAGYLLTTFSPLPTGTFKFFLCCIFLLPGASSAC